MKVTLRTIVGLLSSAVMVSCSNVNDDPSISQTPIDFGTTVSRAAIDSEKDISSYSVWGGYDKENNLFKKTTVYNNGTYEGGTRYWVPNKTFNFYAVHPVLENVNVEDNGNITINSFDCSATGGAAVDLMTATAPNLSGDGAPIVEINFSHELSRLKFTVKAEDGVTATVTNAKLYGVIYKADFAKSGQNTTWENPETYDEINTQFKSETPQSLPIDNIFSDILIIPDDNLDEVIFELTYYFDENSQSQTTKKIMVKTNSTPSWEKGKNYSYTVTIGPTSIQFQPVVTPWNHSTGGIITVE